MIIISTKICTYQLSIVSTITTKKENISWFIENKIEWLVCDVFAIFFFRILSSSRMKVISTHFFIPFRSCHTEFLFVLSSCGGGHEGYIPLIDFIVLCFNEQFLRLDVASEYLVYSFIVFTLSKPFFIRKSKKNF